MDNATGIERMDATWDPSEEPTKPFDWRKPRRVRVDCDMLQGDEHDERIAQVLAVISLTPNQEYQIVTDQPDRLRDLLSSEGFRDEVWTARDRILHKSVVPSTFARGLTFWEQRDVHDEGTYVQTMYCFEPGPPWPLPNVRITVTEEAV